MTGETNDDSFEEAIDNAQLSETDDPETFDYYDPDEDDEVTEQAEGTEDEADEADEADDEAPDQETEDEPTASELADDVLVKMPDGTAIPFGELKDSPMLKADHTRKTQELANVRKATTEKIERIERISNTLVEHLTRLVPPEPDVALSFTDAAAYTQAKAQHDASLAQLQKIIELGGQSKEIRTALSDEDMAALKKQHDVELAAVIPSVGTTQGRADFFEGVNEVAQHIGFSKEEIDQVMDHRVHVLAHWAKKGLDADKAKKAVRKKGQNAPPAQPRKPGQAAKQANSNVKAMQKLARSGSIHDAVNVDFD